MKKILFTALLCTCFTAPAWADMTQFNFTKLTNNNSEDLGMQLSVTVEKVDTTKIAFAFRNDVGIPSSITQIYFYDGVFITGAPTTEEVGVKFLADTAGGGGLPGLDKHASYVLQASVDSEPPVSKNGINSDTDLLRLTFGLFPGATYDSVVQGIRTGDFLIGLHVQSIGSLAGSDSYVTFVPVPGAVLLGFLGLGYAGMRLRREV